MILIQSKILILFLKLKNENNMFCSIINTIQFVNPSVNHNLVFPSWPQMFFILLNRDI